MKKIMSLVIVLLAIASMFIIFYINNNKVKNNVKLQVIQFDIMDSSEKIVKEANVQVNDIIELEKFDGNNIKILEINDKNIKISREAMRYEILSQTSLYSGEVKEYNETVIENVKYNTFINININSRHPFRPEDARARYDYYIKFIK